MLQRSQGIPSRFQQESINLPVASNQMHSNLVMELQQKHCSIEAPVNKTLRHWCSDMLNKDRSSQEEKAEFRFSMSRLPNWARHQVADNLVPVDIDYNSSKVGAPLFHSPEFHFVYLEHEKVSTISDRAIPVDYIFIFRYTKFTMFWGIV